MFKKLVGSIEQEANHELGEHQRTNPTLLKYKRPLSQRYLRRFFSEPTIFAFIAVYVSIVLVCWVDGFLFSKLGLNLSILSPPSWATEEIGKDLLMVQITALGLLFPIAISLVTMLMQGNVTASTGHHIRVYYSESLAFQVGAGCISLSIVLMAYIFITEQNISFLIDSIESLLDRCLPWCLGERISSILSKPELVAYILPVVHLWWITVNFIALWYFLKTSLSFVQHEQRSQLRKQYVANVALPNEIKSRILVNKFTGEYKEDRLYFGFYGVRDGYITEAQKLLSGTYILADVWMRPLLWVCERWERRLNESDGQEGDDDNSSNILSFPLLPGCTYSGNTVLCYRRNGPDLTRTEKWIVNNCFRFKRVR